MGGLIKGQHAYKLQSIRMIMQQVRTGLDRPKNRVCAAVSACRVFLKWSENCLQAIVINDGKRFVLLSLLGVILLTTGANAETRKLKIYYLHTGEKATIAFKKNGRFLPEGLKKVNYLLRDWRRNEPTKMDPHLLDLIWEIYRKSGSRSYIHVISGYRSPATNSMLRKRSRGVARKSQHTRGKAVDFFLPDVKLARLRKIGLIKQFGGVGYYPRSGSPFVHIDTGNVRHWPRMTRKELVKIFPRGRTLHIPADGKPLPGYELALADYNIRKPSGKRIRFAKNTNSKPKNFLQRLVGLRKKDKKSVNPLTPSREKPLSKESVSRPVPVRNVPAEKQPQSEASIIAGVPVPLVSEPVLERLNRTNNNADNIALSQLDSQNEVFGPYKETDREKTDPVRVVVPFVRPESSSTLTTSPETVISPRMPTETGNIILASNNGLLMPSTNRKLRALLIAQADNQAKANQFNAPRFKRNLKIALLSQQDNIVVPSRNPVVDNLTQTASIGFKPVNFQSQKDDFSLPDSGLAFVQNNVSRDGSLVKLRAMIKQQSLKLARKYAKRDNRKPGEKSVKILLSSLATTEFPTTSSRQRKVEKTIVQSSQKAKFGQPDRSAIATDTNIVASLTKADRNSDLSVWPQTYKKTINQISRFMLVSDTDTGIINKMRPPTYSKAIIHHIPKRTGTSRFVFSVPGFISEKSEQSQGVVRLN